jgi:hypothetical protein
VFGSAFASSKIRSAPLQRILSIADMKRRLVEEDGPVEVS